MPDWLQRHLGIPSGSQGEGTAWRVLWEPPWPAWIPDWLGTIFVVLAGSGLIWVLWQDTRSHSRRVRSALVTLRLLVYALILIVLFQPVLSVNRTVKPTAVVLIDTSESMSLQDQYSESLASQLKARLEAAGFSQQSRLGIAQSTLLHEDAEFLTSLLETHKLRIYSFDEEIRLVGQVDTPSEANWESLLDSVRKLDADGERTRPGSAIRSLLEEMKGMPPSTVILLSDGIATGAEREKSGELGDALPDLKQQRVSLWSVGIGSSSAARDLELNDVQTPETAFLGDPISVESFVSCVGFQSQTTELRLMLEETEELLLAETIELSESEGTASHRLEWQPDRTGELVLRIELVPVEGETDPHNNTLIRTVYVRDQPLKVLLADRVPRYEFRFLRDFLEREKGVELDTVLFEADARQTLQDRSGQRLGGRFPVQRDQLFAYDTIIIGDVGPRDLGPGATGLLREYVEVAGKSLILVAGPVDNPESYRETQLADLLPVELASERFLWPHRWKSEGFDPEPTIAGLQGTPAFQWGTSAAELMRLWEEFPPWYRLFPRPKLKSGAVAWLVAPFPPGDDRPPVPLIVEHRFGAGKVLFHATDELWRIRYLSGDLYYGKYWLQTLRYLTRPPSNAAGVELTTDRRIYRQGETVKIRLRIPDAAPGAAPRVSVKGTREFERDLTASPDHPELFLGDLEGLPEGNYRAEYGLGDSTNRVTQEFRIEQARRELTDRNLNKSELQRVAEESGGNYFTPAKAAQIPRSIPAGQTILLENLKPLPLWNRWELFVAILVLLTAEWILRKRVQLL